MSLTEKQMIAKQKAEAAGQVFVPPSQYKAMMMDKPKPKYSKKAVKVNPQQVAAYSARKAYKSDFKEISPDTDMLIDQVLNPEDVNETTRWPNTYGLSATYKCKTIINAKFSSDNRCCVAVNPTVRDAIFTTNGSETNITLAPYNTTSSPNPYSFQDFVLQTSNAQVPWSAPIILTNRQAILPFPNAQTGQLLYPAGFSFPAGATENVVMSFRFPAAIGDQAGISIFTYDSNFQLIRTASASIIGLQGNPAGIGTDIGFVEPGDDPVSYFAIQVYGRSLPYYGPVYAFMRNEEPTLAERAILEVPNHAQHVNIFDIRDADTIADSATQAFVLAQSLLITAEMSDLNNGGVLAIARVPGATVVGEGDDEVDFNTWYDWIASLPYNSYDGAVKKGGYAWYLPEDETGFFYRPLDTYFSKELPFMVSEFTASDTTEAAIVRIKVCTIVQFTTTSSVYDCRPSCYVSEMAFMHHILSLVQAAYSNDGHKGGLKANLKKVGDQVIKLLKNPKTYTTVAQIVKGLGAALI